jgi:Protein kinase domain
MPGIGDTFAGYHIEAMLARGGMSTVFQAQHDQLARRVAIKILTPELAQDERFRERFIRESRLAASLDHPNIIPIYDAGEVNKFLFIAMRYVESSLKVVLEQERSLAPAPLIRIASQVADALDAAHALNLVHRDVKPANVLIARPNDARSSHVYLADFGLTKHVHSRSGLTGTGEFVGTIDYTAPEQIEGKEVDGRSDVYSFGCMLFECLTGEVPFPRESDAAVLWAHLQDGAPLVSSLRSDCPQGIDEVIATAMAKAPQDRYGTCGEVVTALRQQVGSGDQVAARRAPGATVVRQVGSAFRAPAPVPSEQSSPAAPPSPAPGAMSPLRIEEARPEGRPAEPPRPQPPDRPRGRPLSTPLVAGVVGALLIAAVALGWTFLRGEGDAGLLEDIQVRSHLPGGVEPCKSSPEEGGDIPAAVTCEPTGTGGPSRVDYRFFHDGTALTEWYVEQRGSMTSSSGRCAVGNAESPWYGRDSGGAHSLERDAGARGGRVLCRDSLSIIWTDSATKLSGWATVDEQSDYPALYEWWLDGGGPTHHIRPPDDLVELADAGDYPNELEDEQIDSHVPDHFSDCDRTQLPPTAPSRGGLTGVRCSVDNDVVTSVEYFYFYDGSGMASYFNEQQSTLAVGECDPPLDRSRAWVGYDVAGTHDLTPDGPPKRRGRVFCYHSADDQAIIEWVDFSARLYGRVSAPDDEDVALIDGWLTESGPAHPDEPGGAHM